MKSIAFVFAIGIIGGTPLGFALKAQIAHAALVAPITLQPVYISTGPDSEEVE